jgi:hypothetical protein
MLCELACQLVIDHRDFEAQGILQARASYHSMVCKLSQTTFQVAYTYICAIAGLYR